MRRRRVIIGLAVLALAAVAALLLWPRGPRPCRATFEQVREGMTFEEVCATVGTPPGNYTTGDRFNPPISSGFAVLCERWLADDGELYVDFVSGRVAWYYTTMI